MAAERTYLQAGDAVMRESYESLREANPHLPPASTVSGPSGLHLILRPDEPVRIAIEVFVQIPEHWIKRKVPADHSRDEEALRREVAEELAVDRWGYDLTDPLEPADEQ